MRDAATLRPHSNLSTALQIWLIGALLPLCLILTGEANQYDFSALWVAAKQAIAGDAGAIYSATATQLYADQLHLGRATIFPYPPHALFAFLPFAILPYIPAYLAWNVATAAFFYWAARPCLPKGFPPILSILTPAALICVDFGQTGLAFGGLWLLAFRGRWAAVALLTVKPHVGLLSILSLRRWSAFWKTVALTIGLMLASVAAFGFALWPAFLENLIVHAEKMTAMERWFHAGVTPAIGYGFWGWIAFAIAGALLLAKRVNVFTAATATFLISPYGFHYDMTVVCLGFGLLIFSEWHAMPIRHRIPIALGFLSPVIAIAGVWWMPPIIGYALWAQVKYDAGPVRHQIHS
nr:glycosyltransferase family 87 protein [Sphingomonas brevis]